MHQVEYIYCDRHWVFHAVLRQFNWIAILIEHVRIVQAEHLYLVADRLTAHR